MPRWWRSTRGSSFRHLDVAPEGARVLGGDPDDAGAQVPANAGAGVHRRPVVGDGDELAVRDLAALGVVRRELDLGLGALELELRHALDRRPREQRLVAD